MNARDLTDADLTDADLIAQLRKAGSIWFRNDTLLLLEELIRRYRQEMLLAESRSK